MKRNLQEAVDNFIRMNGTNCSLWIERLSERGATSYAAETQLPAASLAKLLIVDAAISGRSIDDLDVPVTTIAELEPTHYPTLVSTGGSFGPRRFAVAVAIERSNSDIPCRQGCELPAGERSFLTPCF